jgi:hypothetical protein
MVRAFIAAPSENLLKDSQRFECRKTATKFKAAFAELSL